MAYTGKGVIIDINESQQPEGTIPIFLIETASDIEGFLLCANWPSGQSGDPIDLIGRAVSFDLERINSSLVGNPWVFEDGTGQGPAKSMTIAGVAVKSPDALQ